MDHPTHQALFPCLAPDSKLLQKIAALRRWLDRLLSFSCKTVLVLIPVLFAVAHIAADGEPWDFATGEKYSPFFDVISSYAWRSPAGWAMVACMAGFAFGLGFVSWHAMKRGPGFFSWLTAVSAAIAMVLVLQAAWVPFKPDRATYSQIQMEMAQEPTHQAKREIWQGGVYAVGLPLPEGAKSPAYFKSLRSHWIHQHALAWAQVLVVVAIATSFFLWSSRRPDGRFWRSFIFWAEWVVLILVGGGLLGRLWLPEFNGLTQRLCYLGFYLWLLVIVRVIVRQRLPAPESIGVGEGNELDESGREVTLCDQAWRGGDELGHAFQPDRRIVDHPAAGAVVFRLNGRFGGRLLKTAHFLRFRGRVLTARARHAQFRPPGGKAALAFPNYCYDHYRHQRIRPHRPPCLPCSRRARPPRNHLQRRRRR